jgi:hypothetical protein
LNPYELEKCNLKNMFSGLKTNSVFGRNSFWVL